MTLRATLLTRIETHCASFGLSEREFGYAAVQDGRLVARLREGMGTIKVIEKVEAFLDGTAGDAREARSRKGRRDASLHSDRAA